jgi:hypothetical protein
MPDTKILPTPWGEETLMDSEVREAFARLESRLDETNGKIFDLLRAQADSLNGCKVELATCRTRLEDDINGVGERLNDHIKDHEKAGDKRWAVWLALISAAILWLWEIVKSLGGKRLAP